MKKESKAIVIALIVLFLIALFFLIFNKTLFIDEKIAGNKSIGNLSRNVSGEIYCDVDSDCVPASCCHPKSCVVKSSAPKCGRIFCTQECSSNSMDCGQGSCACVKNKCGAVFK